jgi:hypothetical protein
MPNQYSISILKPRKVQQLVVPAVDRNTNEMISTMIAHKDLVRLDLLFVLMNDYMAVLGKVK